MSLGGLRDPRDPGRDTYSQLEADAVAYAVSKGVLVVAAVGNSDQAPSQPWPYASWPAALPHVLGVSALSRTGGSPAFSNRDPQFNDIAAPGEEILSTFPLPLTAAFPACAEQGYSSCGPEEYRTAEGTTFAAPQVTAAAAMLLATSPTLSPDQVVALLEQSAVDARPAQRLRRVRRRPRPRSRERGGSTSTAAIELLAAGEPPRDRYEPNDDGGHGRLSALRLPPRGRGDARLLGRPRRRLPRLPAQGRAPASRPPGRRRRVRPALALWRPGTEAVDAAAAPVRRLAARPPGAALGFTASVRRLVLPRRARDAARRRAVPARRREVPLSDAPGGALRRGRAARPRARRAARAPGSRRRRRAAARPS